MMEKEHKLKNRILKILPKAASAVTVTFQNPPLISPGRDHPTRTKKASRWSKLHGASMVSMIPDEARAKAKDGGGSNIDSQEPTSPKVSCMGQIKHKKKQIKKAKAKSMSMPKDVGREVKDDASTSRKIFHRAKHAGRKSSAAAAAAAAAASTMSDHDKEEALAGRAPVLSEMKRFASGRNALTKFDWKVHAPEEMEPGGYFSDQDRDESDAEGEEREVIIPFSAPILVGGGCRGGGVPLQPRKEINLWKRRTMAPPRPLQLKPAVRAN